MACFSMTGKIGGIAEGLAQRLNAEYVEIKPKNESSIFKGVDGMRSYFRFKAAIKPCQTDLTDYDHLVIVSSAATASASSYVMKYVSLIENAEGKLFSTVTRASNANRSESSVYTVGSAPDQIKKELEKKGMIFSKQFTIPGRVTNYDGAKATLSEIVNHLSKEE